MLLLWKDELQGSLGLGTWTNATLPCDDVTLEPFWAGVTCGRVDAESAEGVVTQL